MPTVTITVDRDNNVSVVPPRVVTNPKVGLNVFFNLVNNGTLVPASPTFISFPWPVPTGAGSPSSCSSWTQYTGTVSSGPGPNQNQARMPALPVGTNACYKYSIVFTTQTIDPEVENEGPPPTEGEGKPPRGPHGQPGQPGQP
jgi:hypothetical protein